MAKKRSRANGDGDVFPRKNKEGKVTSYRGAYVGPDGKRRYVSGKNKEEARNNLRKARSEADEGIVFDAQNLSVSAFLDRWLEDGVKGSVRISTHQRYAEIVELHLAPGLGRVKLKALTPAHVQRFYRDRLDSGLSPATVRKFHNVLHKALSQAVRWSLIPRNVTEATSPPRPAPKETNTLSADEAGRLLEAAKGDRLEALWVLAVHTGMRQGELLALMWKDVDLEAGKVSVRRTLTREGGRYSFGEPKTKGSRRTVKLTNAAMETLRAHLGRQMDEMERLGDLYRDQGLVFTSDSGAPVNPSNLRNRNLKRLTRAASVPEIRFHDLRHTCATLLLGKNVHPKLVQALLGHASMSITMDLYSHWAPEMGDQAAAAMDEALTR